MMINKFNVVLLMSLGLVSFTYASQFNNSGTFTSDSPLNLNYRIFCGSGRLEAPEITIKAEIFAYTSVIHCDGQCIIISEKEFDPKSFTFEGGGQCQITIGDRTFLLGEVDSGSDFDTSSKEYSADNYYFYLFIVGCVSSIALRLIYDKYYNKQNVYVH